MIKVAIQGQAGSFHDEVAQTWFGDYTRVSCDTFHDVFAALDTEKASAAVVAIENTLYGSIADVYDLLLQHPYKIAGEVVLHVHQQLIACSKDIRPAQLTDIYSHPVALNQCREWLETHAPQARLIEHHDTAGAVEYIKQLNSRSAGAIASSHAAQLHKLPITAHDIEDEKTNLTRFVIIDKKSQAVDKPNKASLVLTTNHASGALYKALEVFAQNDANLTKLQSRPIRGSSFRYQFFIDAECERKSLAQICDELRALDYAVTLLGHYRAADMP